MSTDGKSNGTSASLASIYELQLDTAEKVGNMHGRLHSIEADVSAVRQGFVKQGLVLGELQATCAVTRSGFERRLQKHSEEVGAVKEDTGVIHLEDVKRKAQWGLVAKVGGAILALVGASGLTWGVTRQEPTAAIPPVPVVVPVEAPAEQLEDLKEKVEDLQQRLPRMDWFNIGVRPRKGKKR